MEWIKENKFLSGLLGITIFLAGGIFYFGYTEGVAFDEKMAEYGDQEGKYITLVNAKPYPDPQNLEARQGNIKKYEEVIAEMRKKLVGYQPGKLPQLTPGEFSDVQLNMQNELRKAFGKAGTTLPEKCGFGFEKYASIQAKAETTAMLNYQLGAMQWLLGKLAETKPEALINIRREDPDIKKMLDPVAGAQPPGRRGRRPAKKDVNPAEQNIFMAMPIELAFTASESSVRDFLKEMANSKEYFYAIRAIRIRNEKQNAPTQKDASFKAASSSDSREAIPAGQDNPFGDFALPGEVAEESEDDANVSAAANAPEPLSTGEHILKQVLGSEKINIHISFDILLIKVDKMPKSNSDAPSSGA